MNLNPFYKSKQIIGLIIFSFLGEIIWCGSIAADEKDKKEILNIGEKRRTYYQLHNNELNYHIKGAMGFEVISRRAVPKKITKSKKFGYQIIIDGKEPVRVEHEGRIAKGVASSQHPGHGYTKSGSSIYKLGKGDHHIQMLPLKSSSGPVLIRLIKKHQTHSSGNGVFMKDLENSEKVHIKIGDKKIRYYPMDDSTELVFSSTGPKMIKVITRLAFEPWMGKQMQYRIQILKEQVIHETYFFQSEKSDQSIVMENKEVVPGKWRSIDIQVPEGEHRYTVKLLDLDMKIYIRSMEYEIE